MRADVALDEWDLLDAADVYSKDSDDLPTPKELLSWPLAEQPSKEAGFGASSAGNVGDVTRFSRDDVAVPTSIRSRTSAS